MSFAESTAIGEITFEEQDSQFKEPQPNTDVIVGHSILGN